MDLSFPNCIYMLVKNKYIILNKFLKARSWIIKKLASNHILINRRAYKAVPYRAPVTVELCNGESFKWPSLPSQVERCISFTITMNNDE